MNYISLNKLTLLPRRGQTLRFSGLSQIDFVQMNYDEYQALSQITRTNDFKSFASIKIECVRNLSTLVTLNIFSMEYHLQTRWVSQFTMFFSNIYNQSELHYTIHYIIHFHLNYNTKKK